LADADRRDEALAAIEEAVEIDRRLATANATAYEPALAMSLDNLSLRLADAGRPVEAEQVQQQAEDAAERAGSRARTPALIWIAAGTRLDRDRTTSARAPVAPGAGVVQGERRPGGPQEETLEGHGPFGPRTR
jgi:hypothetical protein